MSAYLDGDPATVIIAIVLIVVSLIALGIWLAKPGLGDSEPEASAFDRGLDLDHNDD